MTKNVKSRNWTFLVYPESAPENWEDILMGCTYCYCLHDKDVNKDTGKLKKAHIHVLLAFDGTTTYNAVKDLTDRLNSPIPQPARSLRGMIRYLIHADNKNKYHYNREDIVSVGMDQEIEQAFTPKKTDEDKKNDHVTERKKLVHIIDSENLIDWDQLNVVLDKLDDTDLTIFADNHAYLVTQWLKSNWRKLERERRKQFAAQ